MIKPLYIKINYIFPRGKIVQAKKTKNNNLVKSGIVLQFCKSL